MPSELRLLSIVFLTAALAQPATAADPEWANTFRGDDWFKHWAAKESWGLADNCSAADGVLRVRFPKGSVSPSYARESGAAVGGAQWYARPLPPRDDLTLGYAVRFPDGFDFVKGGKLPGLFGGTAVSDGDEPDGTNGFSTRFMWRRHGDGEVYAYLYGRPAEYGNSLGRGRWRFVPGKWHRLEQRVRLNDPGQADGSITVWFDGKQIYEATDLRFRTVPALKIEGVFFSTFFGGHDRTWATPADTSIEFKDFTLSGK